MAVSQLKVNQERLCTDIHLSSKESLAGKNNLSLVIDDSTLRALSFFQKKSLN